MATYQYSNLVRRRAAMAVISFAITFLAIACMSACRAIEAFRLRAADERGKIISMIETLRNDVHESSTGIDSNRADDFKHTFDRSMRELDDLIFAASQATIARLSRFKTEFVQMDGAAMSSTMITQLNREIAVIAKGDSQVMTSFGQLHSTVEELGWWKKVTVVRNRHTKAMNKYRELVASQVDALLERLAAISDKRITTGSDQKKSSALEWQNMMNFITSAFDTHRRETDRRFDSLGGETNRRFDSLSGEIKEVKSTVETNRQETNRRFDSLSGEIKEVKSTFETNRQETNRRFDSLSGELKNETATLRREFHDGLSNLRRELRDGLGNLRREFNYKLTIANLQSIVSSSLAVATDLLKSSITDTVVYLVLKYPVVMFLSSSCLLWISEGMVPWTLRQMVGLLSFCWTVLSRSRG
jgi:predicted  nucleic acid-binding Zn-ribbon protein